MFLGAWLVRRFTGEMVAHGLDPNKYKPPKLVVLSTVDGKAVATFSVFGLNDEMWFDAAHQRIYPTGPETYHSIRTPPIITNMWRFR